MKVLITNKSLILFLILSITKQAFGQFQINGDATVIGPNTFQLTPNIPWKSGSAWYQVKQNLDYQFSVRGQIYLGATDAGADGVVFVLQDNCLTAGTSGGGIGYENMQGNSIGIEFDTYQNNTNGDILQDHLAINIMGNVNHSHPNNVAGPVQIHATKANVEDGLWYDYEINYSPVTTQLEVFFDGSLRLSYNIDLKNSIFGGNPFVYWGFVSATGGLSAEHKVSVGYSTSLINDDTICSGNTTINLPPIEGVNKAINATSNSSTNLGGGSGPPSSNLAFDGNNSTKWSSQNSDPQWLSVDLGASINIDEVVLKWDTNYAIEYKIQTSNNNTTWVDLFHETSGNGGVDSIKIPAFNIRYVRMYGIQRVNSFNYSLWEFEVYSIPKYAWTPNDGSINDTTSSNPVFSPKTTTTYSVSIPDACVGSVNFNYTVVVDNYVDASFPFVGPFCHKEAPFLLTGNSPGTFEGVGVNGNMFDPSIVPGPYILKHWVKDSTGCVDTAFQNVVVKPLPSLNFGSDTVICDNENLILIVEGSNISSTWNDGSTDSTLEVTNAGIYWVNAMDTTGCAITDSITVSIKPSPKFSFGNDTTLCEDQAFILSAGVSGTQFIWSTGDTTSTISVFNKPDLYALTVIDNNCTFTDSLEVKFIWFPKVKLPRDTVICEKSIIHIIPNSSNETYFEWHDGSEGNTFYANTEERIIVKAGNECFVDTDTMFIETQSCECLLYIPNSFSPNRDGNNDFFRAIADCENIVDYNLSIYNLWGELMFETSSLSEVWDGKFQNLDVPIGVYAVKIKLQAQMDNFPLFKNEIQSLTLFR